MSYYGYDFMSITTYKCTMIFGGWADPSECEDFFLRLRDAAMSCGYWLQGIDLDCHFEGCRISQSPQSGWDFGDRDKIDIVPLDEARRRDKESDEAWARLAGQAHLRFNGTPANGSISLDG